MEISFCKFLLQRRISASNLEEVLTDDGDYFIQIVVSDPQKVGDGMSSYLAYK